MEKPTMKNLRYALLAGAALAGLALTPTGALAMPNGLASASSASSSNVENVAWVCGPYRCWWRPYGYAYGPGWGWHRWYHWHRGYHWHRW